jgi:hypothetical protein
MRVTELPGQAIFGSMGNVSITRQAKQFHAVGTDLIP